LVSVEAQFAIPVPDGLSDDVAAQMLVNPITVAMLRREAEKQFATGYDGVVLNNAAGGAVGRLLTAGSDFHHLATISIVRTADGAAILRERFPAVPVVSTDGPGWPARYAMRLVGARSLRRGIRSAAGWGSSCSTCCHPGAR
jgi:NADPH:quinone reductase-like Zn-dependent oxidoreductase